MMIIWNNYYIKNLKFMKLTPKEKAKELFDHYHILITAIGGELENEILVGLRDIFFALIYL